MAARYKPNWRYVETVITRERSRPKVSSPPAAAANGTTTKGSADPAFHPYLAQHPDLKLHPDFATTGDVLLLCRDAAGAEVGFRVRSSVLRTSSGAFVAELGTTRFAEEQTIAVPDSPEDTYAVLRFLHLGAAGPAGARFCATLQQYRATMLFLDANDGAPATRALLKMHAELAADRLLSDINCPTGSEKNSTPTASSVADLLALAHGLAAEVLWAQILYHANSSAVGWRVLLDPFAAEEDEVARLGFHIWSILVLIARVRATAGVELKDMVVKYPSAKTVVVGVRNKKELEVAYSFV